MRDSAQKLPEVFVNIVLTGVFGLIGLLIVLGYFGSLFAPSSGMGNLLVVGVILAVIVVVTFVVRALDE